MLLLAISITIATSASENSGTCGDNLTWTLNNGVLTISGTGDMTDYTKNNRPSWYGDEAIRNSITKVVVKSGVTSIGDRSFAGCSNLLTADLPATVTEIGEYAFNGCGLVQSPLRAGVQVIGESAFQSCSGLASVTIPGSVREIGRYAFEKCDNLARVVVESGVTTLSKYMFRNCEALVSVTIKEGVTTVESYAFAYCYALKNISIPKSMSEIDGSAFHQTTGLKNVYYGGAQADWEKIYTHTEWGDKHFTEFGNSDINRANLHLRSAMPPQIAYASTQIITVDGKKVELQAYALLDEQGYPTNYVKVRDIGYLLRGTPAQFAVEWDGRVKLVKGEAYTPVGTEMYTPFSGDRNYLLPDTATVIIEGGYEESAKMDCIMLTDDNGGGYTYYKLRDLGKRLGFYVGWTAEEGIIIDSTRKYDKSTEN